MKTSGNSGRTEARSYMAPPSLRAGAKIPLATDFADNALSATEMIDLGFRPNFALTRPAAPNARAVEPSSRDPQRTVPRSDTRGPATANQQYSPFQATCANAWRGSPLRYAGAGTQPQASRPYLDARLQPFDAARRHHHAAPIHASAPAARMPSPTPVPVRVDPPRNDRQVGDDISLHSFQLDSGSTSSHGSCFGALRRLFHRNQSTVYTTTTFADPGYDDDGMDIEISNTTRRRW
jgi:hypothetical protein